VILLEKEKTRKCIYCDSVTKVKPRRKFNNDLICDRHYMQLKTHGKIFEDEYKVNKIILYDSYAEVVIYDISRNEKCRAIVDLDDVERIKNYKWYEAKGYIKHTIQEETKRYNILLHRFIMNPPDNMVVDHINHNPLDNRKENLRICTQQQNNMNSDKGFSVHFSKRDGSWIVQIKINNKNVHIASLRDWDYAIMVRLKAEQIVQGEYSDQKDEYWRLDAYDELKDIRTIEDLKKYMSIIANFQAIHKNTSSVKGVYFNKLESVWVATITIKGEKHYLGKFKSFEEAKEARLNGETKYYGMNQKDVPSYINIHKKTNLHNKIIN
jgi:hypothetical protein